MKSLIFVLLFGLNVSAHAQVPQFLEETASDISHSYNGGWEFFVGGGVAAFDCDDDMLPDLFFAGGENVAALYRNRSKVGGSLRFEKVAGGLSLTNVTGAYPLDIDGDGLTDVAVLRVGENVLFRGLGDCRFERANEAWGFEAESGDGESWTTAFAATWETEQSWPTLAFGNYVDRDAPGAPFGTCGDNLLYRPAETGGYAPPLSLTPSYCALSMLFTDWNRSGTPSLRVSNDRQYYLTNDDRTGGEQLWHVPPGEPPRLYTEAEGWEKVQIWGMGIASVDLNGDELPEYFLTSMADNKLRTLLHGASMPMYEDIAFDRGVTAHRPFTGDDTNPSTGWHAVFEDVNNDGLWDLFVAKGNVDAMPDMALEDPNNLLLGNEDGTFTEAADQAGLLSFKRGRGAAVVDLNLDGLLDVVVANRGDNAQVWRNVSEEKGDFLAVRLQDEGGNHHGIGSWLELRTPERTLTREVSVGGGHAGGTLGFTHFGLGEATGAELRVRWPDGEVSPWREVPANAFVVVSREGIEPINP